MPSSAARFRLATADNKTRAEIKVESIELNSAAQFRPGVANAAMAVGKARA